MSMLEARGARLYYEMHGSGPLMVLVPGATGAAEAFRPAKDHLTRHYTVVLYDRRGFSRSQLDGPQDYEHRLETDADDLRRLIEHVSDEPATVFGASSGALVALALMSSSPSVVGTLIPFEPPAVSLLPDGQGWIDFFAWVYDLYRQDGMEPALERFRERTFATSDRQAMARLRDPTNSAIRANAAYWFEHELRQYPAAKIDLDALTAHSDRIVPAAGRESLGYPCYAVSAELAERLGREMIELPGGHIGCATQPAEFATQLVAALAPAGHGPEGEALPDRPRGLPRGDGFQRVTDTRSDSTGNYS